MIKTSHNYLDPVALSRLGNMELVARLVVEGFITGLHKSPYQGFSVEFSEHRQYMPGDEIRHIDWKVYGKSDRYYVKKFEEETNLRTYIVLDASGSMNYTFSDQRLTKFQYGCYLAASLAYLMLKQRDSVSLTIFDQEIRDYIPPRSRASHLRAIISTLEKTEPSGDTEISKILHGLAKRIVRRGLVILISDLLDQPTEVLTALKHFRHRKHEIIVLHLIDEVERDFPFDGTVVFRDIETGRLLPTHANTVKASYIRQFNQFVRDYQRGCGTNLIDYEQIGTATKFDYALSSYLSRRK
ncbi:MAG: DUF58 domain-containing protein [Candidatus Poribacteria bacterium]